jgi:hypothetical protein
MSDDRPILFREEQHFRQPWVWACVLVPMASIALVILWQLRAGPPSDGLPAWALELAWTELILAAVLFWLYKMRLVTEVRTDGLVLHFQWLWRRRWIPYADIRRYTVVTYNPIRDYGGWGIRGLPGNMAYNVSGNRGVLLEFNDNAKLLVGSQRPAELAHALAQHHDATPPARTHGWTGE